MDKIVQMVEGHLRRTDVLVWSSLDTKEEASRIREYIGDKRVVTGFHYEFQLKDSFCKFGVPQFERTPFSASRWMELFLGEPFTLDDAKNYFNFALNIKSITSETGTVVDLTDLMTLEDHKTNTCLTATIAVIAHFIVREKL